MSSEVNTELTAEEMRAADIQFLRFLAAFEGQVNFHLGFDTEGSSGKEMKSLEMKLRKFYSMSNSKDNNGTPADKASSFELLSKLEDARKRMATERRVKLGKLRSEMWASDLALYRMIYNHMIKTKLTPDEYCERFLDKFNTPLQRHIFSGAFPFVRNFWKDERPKFLFYEILPILQHGKYLKNKDIMNCRLVCKDWLMAITNWMRSDPCSDELDMEGKLHSGTGTSICPDSFYKMNKASHVLTVELPFFLCFWENPRFWEETAFVFRTSGAMLWHLRFTFDTVMLYHNFYEKLCQFLAYMPLLSSLHIKYVESAVPLDYQGGDIYSVAEVRSHRKPLPELPDMACIRLMNVPPLITLSLLNKYGTHLQGLTIASNDQNPDEYLGGSKLPNLKEFQLLAGDFRGAMKLDVKWPHVNFIDMAYFSVEAETIPAIFKSLSEFETVPRSNLCLLRLTLHKHGGAPVKLDADVMKSLWLDLPYIRSFTLSVFRVGLKNIDFMLPMVSLQEVTLQYVKILNRKSVEEKKVKETASPRELNAASDSPDEIIKFTGYTSKLYESNIWQIFPELTRITIKVITKSDTVSRPELMLGVSARNKFFDSGTEKTRKYTRDGYLAYRMKNLKIG